MKKIAILFALLCAFTFGYTTFSQIHAAPIVEKQVVGDNNYRDGDNLGRNYPTYTRTSTSTTTPDNRRTDFGWLGLLGLIGLAGLRRRTNEDVRRET
jgi:MYXO-CTERM domain-containing protein